MPFKVSSASFTRPADITAYASGDLVANNTTAGSVAPLVFEVSDTGSSLVIVRQVLIRKSGTGVANATFRLHLFNASPAVANGDNGVFAPTLRAAWLGSFADVAVALATSDGAVGRTGTYGANDGLTAFASTRNLWGLLEARGAYTPANAETFQVEIVAEF